MKKLGLVSVVLFASALSVQETHAMEASKNELLKKQLWRFVLTQNAEGKEHEYPEIKKEIKELILAGANPSYKLEILSARKTHPDFLASPLRIAFVKKDNEFAQWLEDQGAKSQDETEESRYKLLKTESE